MGILFTLPMIHYRLTPIYKKPFKSLKTNAENYLLEVVSYQSQALMKTLLNHSQKFFVKVVP